MGAHFKVQLRAVIFLAWCVVLLFGGPASSEAGGPGSLWQSYLGGEGLPSGAILSIAATSDGAIWFGTDAGAARYDGVWKTAADGLPSGRVRAIVQAADGTMWFGTDAGVARRAADGQCCQVWKQSHGLPNNDVHALAVGAPALAGQTKAGVWVGTTQGLAFLDGEHVVRDAQAPVASVQALAVTPGGELLASLDGLGVWRRGADGVWQALTGGVDVSEGPLALYAGADGRIWAGIGAGLVVYHAGRWERFPLLDDDSGPRVLAIRQDGDGGLWAGTERGVFYDADAQPDPALPMRFQAQRDGLMNDYVRALAVDADGGVWFGTISGASRYAGREWQWITDEALDGQRINSVLADSADRIWVGTEWNGLARWDGREWRTFTKRDGLPDDRILAVFEDSVGRTWVSTGGGTGYSRDLAGTAPGAASEFTWLAGVGLVYGFAQDGSGVWLAAEDGLYHWTAEAGVQPTPKFPGQRVNAFFKASDGALWAGTTSAGLLRLTGGVWQPVTGEGGQLRFNDISVNGIGEIEDGSLWVGTYNDGLWKSRGSRWERVDANLASPKILSLSVARRDVWVGTRQGLARYDGRSWQTYDGDALPDSGVLAVARARDGSVWLGTAAGLVHYQPETTRPTVAIEAVNLLPVQGGQVSLSDDAVRDLRVRGADLATSPDDLVYLVQIEGVDVVPQVHAQPLITAYAGRSLAAGVHLLRVQARDAAFNYSQPAEVQVRVPQMLTFPGGYRAQAQNVYFIVTLGVVALGGVAAAGGIGLRTRARDRRRAAELAARQREALERGFNPYIAGEPVREPNMFFGRDDLVRRIFNALHQNSIMIHGARRMGKTTILYQLAAQLREADDPEWAFFPVYIDLEGTPQERFFHTLMEAIWGEFQGYTLEAAPTLRLQEIEAEAYDVREFSADLRILIDCLKEVVAPRKARIVLLLDEMDVVSSYETVIQQQLRRIFMSPLAANLGAVVAGIQISKAWDRVESPWYNMFNEISLEPFSEDVARRLLQEPVEGVYAWEPESVDFVVAQTEGYPHRLQQYALEAVNHMLADGRLRITLEDAQAAHELLERAATS